MYRAKVIAGEMTEGEATAMLYGKSPFEAQGKVKAWPTPYSSDVRTYRLNSPGSQSQDRSLCSIMRREEGGYLSPDWVEWLMGWPISWTSLEPMAALGDWFSGAWWDVEPVDRITTVKTNRVKRLRAIGNGQVPACVVMAWRLLVTDES
tara:strand:- start:638 stop:1084 length:447 start_codon:yes stop_codon:yes gene_type:complete